METLIISWKEKQKAAEALEKGELVCFPTETVYGIGGIASSETVFEKLVAAKRRPADKPFTLMCSNIAMAAPYCELDVRSIAVIKAFMPGEITVLLKAKENCPKWIRLESDFVGVRIPNDPEVLALIDLVGEPLLVPSANRSGERTLSTFGEVKNVFSGEASCIIEGACKSGKPSTIVSMDLANGISLVREGPIPFATIEKTYLHGGMTVSLASDHGGYLYKEEIKNHLVSIGVRVLDEGTFSKDSCDYPIYAKRAAKDVAEKRADFGVLVCTSGEGIMMAANKVKGIRCGIGYDDIVTQKTREHNDANMISFGAAYMKLEDVIRRVDIFLAQSASPEVKHKRRVIEISQIEE